MTVSWQNRAPPPCGRDEEAAAAGRKTAAQRGARERWAPSPVHRGGVMASAGEGVTGRRPGAGCAGSRPTLPPEASGLPSPTCRTAARVRPRPNLGARSATPPREQPGEGAGSPAGGLEAQSRGPACWCVLSPCKENEVALTYNVVLTTAAQQSGSVIHTYIYIYTYIYTPSFSYCFPVWLMTGY